VVARHRDSLSALRDFFPIFHKLVSREPKIVTGASPCASHDVNSTRLSPGFEREQTEKTSIHKTCSETCCSHSCRLPAQNSFLHAIRSSYLSALAALNSSVYLCSHKHTDSRYHHNNYNNDISALSISATTALGRFGSASSPACPGRHAQRPQKFRIQRGWKTDLFPRERRPGTVVV